MKLLISWACGISCRKPAFLAFGSSELTNNMQQGRTQQLVAKLKERHSEASGNQTDKEGELAACFVHTHWHLINNDRDLDIVSVAYCPVFADQLRALICPFALPRSSFGVATPGGDNRGAACRKGQRYRGSARTSGAPERMIGSNVGH